MKRYVMRVLSAASILLAIAILFLWLATAYDPYARIFEIHIRDWVISPGPPGLTLYRHGWVAVFDIPHWVLVASFALLPLFGLLQGRRPDESRTACAVRRLLRGARILSTALLGLTLILWAGSYFVAESFTLQTAHYLYDVKTIDDPTQYPHGPEYHGWIRQDSIQTKHGVIDFYLLGSVDHLTMSAQNVKDWSQLYPRGRFLNWSRNSPSNTVFHFEGPVFNEMRIHFELPIAKEMPTVLLRRFGFFLARSAIYGTSASFTNFHATEIAVPFWFIAVPTAILPALRVLRWLRSGRRAPPGFCLRCGYDLTGNVSGICPECGAACKAADPAGVSPAAGD